MLLTPASVNSLSETYGSKVCLLLTALWGILCMLCVCVCECVYVSVCVVCARARECVCVVCVCARA
jgi:hypothetical protein